MVFLQFYKFVSGFNRPSVCYQWAVRIASLDPLGTGMRLRQILGIGYCVVCAVLGTGNGVCSFGNGDGVCSLGTGNGVCSFGNGDGVCSLGTGMVSVFTIASG